MSLEDELRAHYAKALPSRIAALASARDQDDEEARATIRRIAHALRGSGGTYGFPEISEAAGAVENADPAEMPRRLDALLETLRRAVGPEERARARILLVEDEPTTAVIMEGALDGPSREIVAVPTMAGAEATLADDNVALVVLDLVLPDGDGRNLLIKIRDRAATANLPVIVVSGRVGPRPKAECFALGADTFLEKPFDPAVLQAAVTAKLQRTALAAQDAGSDTRTGRLNRAAFRERFEELARTARAAGRPLCLALVNMDHFLSVIEKHGGEVADAALVRVGEVITDALGPDDVLGFWGGEEFAILMPGRDTADAIRTVEEARAAVRATAMDDGAGGTFDVNFSAGVAPVGTGDDIDRAVASAQRYLYIAKSTGRGKVVGEVSSVSAPRRTIVVAEDDQLVASVVEHRMAKEGFDVVHYANGADLMDAAPELEPSLVILDVKMPGMDGFEVLENLRQMTSFEAIPIIMLTSMGSERDIVRGFDLGANDYVLKPFSPVELVARVHRLLNKR